ncbi:nucleoporin NDC1-like [Halichondria panicea]|uniref:nucleoporin NDC1-like n=1 Tax=Halichondria panicea TaxID=6063 RepID=UPI00312B8BE8
MRWFVQMYRWRALSSALWLCVLAAPLLMLYTTLTSPYHHPLSSGGLSLNIFFLYCLFLSSLMVVMVIYTVTTTAELPVYATRVSMLWSVLRPTHLVTVAVFGFSGGVKGHCLSSLAGYRVWSGEWAFLTAHATLAGVAWGVRYYVDKRRVLVLPSIQQGALFSLRGHTLAHCTQGLVMSLKDLRWIYPLYLLCHWYLSWEVWLTFELVILLLLTGTLSQALRSFALTLFQTFQTQAIAFPIVAMFASESDHLLTHALQANNPLLRALGFLDVCNLATLPGRRAQVFSLDRAGQPGVWRDVSTQCLTLIHKLTNKLTGGDSSTVSMETTTTSRTEVLPPERGWCSLEPPPLTRRGVVERGAGLWSYSPPSNVTSLQPPPPLDNTHSLANQLSGLSGRVRGIPAALVEAIKRKPFFIHFLSTLPGSDEQTLYSDSRLIVCAVRGLSELAVASYTQDQYGVVQRSLGQVVSSLIHLSMALDKHVKAPLSSTPSTGDALMALEKNSKYAIKTAVLTALHRLEATFTRERRAFALTDQQLKYWTSQH